MPKLRRILRLQHRFQRGVEVGAVVVALAVALTVPKAQAFQIDTGNSDVMLRWDNTVKYSIGVRVEDRDEKLLANPNNDDGDQNFDQWSPIFNRLDLFSELDAAYKGWGVRFSGAAWYDLVYNRDNDNDSPETCNRQGDHDTFAEGTEKLHGRKAELLDAFAFGSLDLGSTRLSLRGGQYALQWGETLFFGNNGIAGGMSPVDVVKLLSSPNSQFKEFIRPTPQVSAQYVITPRVAVGAYYKLGWDRVVIPGVGSYFSNGDVLDKGGEQILGPGFERGGDIEARDSGQWGGQVRFRPGAELDLGVYAIRYHDMGPQVYIYPIEGKYRLVFPEDIQAYGVSATRTFGEFNWAVEASIRRNAPLPSGGAVIGPAPGMAPEGDNSGNALYAVGNTAHANLNWLASLGPSFISNEADFLGEIVWNRCLSVTDDPQDLLDPGTTRDAWGFRLVYEPKYRQVLPGLDLSVPTGFAYFPEGRSRAITNFGPHHGGDMNIGLAGSYLDVWRFGLNYTHYYGPRDSFQDETNNNVFTYKQSLADRDYVSFFIKRTF